MNADVARLAVYVAVHKPYELPDDPAYRPVHVGRALGSADLGIPGDDTGENISTRNTSYCELTALYWAWRNGEHDAYGLTHYRRYFAGEAQPSGVASGREMRDWLRHCDLVLPRVRRYYVETVRQQYEHAHHGEHLDAARDAIAERSPRLMPAFDELMGRRSLSLYNMFLMRKELADDYCGWLFHVLEGVDERVDLDALGPAQRRLHGYLGERLLNVWAIGRADTLRTCRRPIVSVEGERLLPKAVGLVGRKLGLVERAQ